MPKRERADYYRQYRKNKKVEAMKEVEMEPVENKGTLTPIKEAEKTFDLNHTVESQLSDMERVIAMQNCLTEPIFTQFPLYCPRPRHLSAKTRRLSRAKANRLEPHYLEENPLSVIYECPSCRMEYRIDGRYLTGNIDDIERHFKFIQYCIELPEEKRKILDTLMKQPIEYRRAIVYFASHPIEWGKIKDLLTELESPENLKQREIIRDEMTRRGY